MHLSRRNLLQGTVLAGAGAWTGACVSTLPASHTEPGLYFPGDAEWETVSPNAVGWQPPAIDAALEFAMDRNSTSVVLLHRGRILAERHHAKQRLSQRLTRMTQGKNSLGQPIEDVASVQKSVVSFLVGVAQEKGLVKLSDPVHKHLGEGWSKAEAQYESAITLRHLITMTSGLSVKLRRIAKPGTVWRYNTTAYSKSLTAIAKASGMSENELTAKWLTKPIGMADSRWVRRPRAITSVADANPFGFATTARDLARFGLLMLAQGGWGDKTLLKDQQYLTAATSSSQQMNPSYGYLWWLNGKEFVLRGARKINGSLTPTAPRDMFAAQGALGRKCYVVPSLELVVTRLGDTPDKAGKPFDREFWRLLMKGAPA